MQPKPAINPAEDNAEVTVATTPHFGAEAAKVARQVVSLERVESGRAAAQSRGPQVAFRPPVRRSWPRAFILTSVSAAVVLGGVSTAVLRRHKTVDASTPNPAIGTIANETAKTPAPSPPVQTTSGSDFKKAPDISKRPAPVARKVLPERTLLRRSARPILILRLPVERIERKGDDGGRKFEKREGRREHDDDDDH